MYASLVQRVVESPGNHCFVCSPHNPHGLRLHFGYADGEVSATFTPDQWHQGWQGVIHGGILAALLDEAMAYTLFFAGLRGVTVRMNVRYRKAVHAGETIVVSARLSHESPRLADIVGYIRRDDGLAVEASARFMKLGTLHPDTASPLDLDQLC